MNSPLFQAAGRCDLQLLEQTLEGDYGEVSQEDLNDALIRACERGYSECVGRLLIAHADCNAEDGRGNPAIVLAAQGGHTRAIRLLLAAGVDVNAMMDNGRTALHMAARLSLAPVALQLLRSGSGCNPDCQDDNDDTPAMYAAENGSAIILQILLHQEAKVDLCNTHGNLAIHYAAESGDALCCALLQEAGSDLQVTNTWRDTPLLIACRNGHDKAARSLVPQGSDIHAMDRHDRTPLHYAIKHGLVETTKSLLDAGAMDIMDADCTTPLMEAVIAGQYQLTRSLVGANFNVNAIGKYKPHGKNGGEPSWCTPLEVALRLGDLTTADLLLMAGASLRTVKVWAAGENIPTEMVGNDKVMSWIHTAVEKPLPLMAQSRLAIRNCLGFWPLKKLVKLKIPIKMIYFLNYKPT